MCINDLSPEEYLILSRSDTRVPMPSTVEKFIREGIEVWYGPVYAECILGTMTVSSCDAENLIIHVESEIACDIIRNRLLPVFKTIISDIYNIHPAISVVHTE